MKQDERLLTDAQIAFLLVAAVSSAYIRQSAWWGIGTAVFVLLIFLGYRQNWWGAAWEQSTSQRHDLLAYLRSWMPKKAKTPSLKIYDVILGRHMDGSYFTTNLETMKSFAVWAMNGSGKTSFLHSLVHDLISSHRPTDLKLVICDLKDGLDFRIYQRLPHLLLPIATTVEEASRVLRLLDAERERRSMLFRAVPESRKCNSLNDYHRLIVDLGLNLPQLPRIVAIFDEAQEIMTNDEEAERILIKLAKLGRAYGISIGVSTQLPDADAIPKGLRSQLVSRFVGRMASPRDYYAIAEVTKEYYEGVVLAAGQFFAQVPGFPLWTILQASLIPDEELEAAAAHVSEGHSLPTWLDEAGQKPTSQRKPWNGSNAQKVAMFKAWLMGWGERPTSQDAMNYFDMSQRTAEYWIAQYWPEIEAEKNS